MAGLGKETRVEMRKRGASVIGELRALCLRNLARLEGEKFPMVAYQKDPVAFVREKIGEEPEPHQIEIMMAVAASPMSRVAVRSGQKTGKTKLVIWLSLWFYACFPDARVFMTASTGEQIKRVLWVELRKTIHTAKKLKGTDFGRPALDPETGLTAPDFRQIMGFTTRMIESMAGLSSPNMLYVGDEASALEERMAEAIEGNTAGDARIIWISNPTRAEGPFYDAFFSKRQFWTPFHLSSETLALKLHKEGRRVPGLASLETLKFWKEKYGEDSPFYVVRAKGDFLLNEQGKIVSLFHLQEAQRRYAETPAVGRLSIGIDPAGDSGEGDRYVFTGVRGAKMIEQFAFRGLSEEAAIAHALDFLKTWRRGDETPIVVIDAEGPIGSAFYGRMRAIANHTEIHDPPNAFECIGLKGSQDARRMPQLYVRIRDELWCSLADWMRTGAITEDYELEQEIYAPGWEVTIKGKRQATHKRVLRERLGRSPDKADSLSLAVWNPSPWTEDALDPKMPTREDEGTRGPVDVGEPPDREVDHYEGLMGWDGRIRRRNPFEDD